MALHLNCGSLGDREISNEFGLTSSPESLSDVGHDRNTGALNLVPKAKIFQKQPRARSPVNLGSQGARPLPALNILETRNYHTKEGAS